MSASLVHCFEATLYALVSFLPYLVLALYPFQDKLRFSKEKTIGMIFLLSVIHVILWIGNAVIPYESAAIISTLCTVCYLIFYFIAIDTHYGQIAYIVLILSNISNFIEMTSKSIESFIFPRLATESYHWSFILIVLIVEIIVLIPIYYYIKYYYTQIFHRKTTMLIWRYLWTIPGTFYIIWYHHLYASGHSRVEQALEPSNTFYMILMSIGSMFIYHIVAKLILVLDDNAQLSEKNHVLALQNLQYNKLQDRINDARRAKHDVRHHIAILKSYAEKQDYDKLKNYLNQYQDTLPDDSSVVFCENLPANVILLYFAQIAKNNDVDFAVQTVIPADINIPENDLSVLLGNLLENAMDACRVQKNHNRQVNIKAKTNKTAFFFTVDNTFDGPVRQNIYGDYLSTKENGSGIGLISVKQIVDKYDGTLNISHDNMSFRVSVMLNIPQ